MCPLLSPDAGININGVLWRHSKMQCKQRDKHRYHKRHFKCMYGMKLPLNANATILNEIFSDTLFFEGCPGYPGFHCATPLIGLVPVQLCRLSRTTSRIFCTHTFVTFHAYTELYLLFLNWGTPAPCRVLLTTPTHGYKLSGVTGFPFWTIFDKTSVDMTSEILLQPLLINWWPLIRLSVAYQLINQHTSAQSKHNAPFESDALDRSTLPE